MNIFTLAEKSRGKIGLFLLCLLLFFWRLGAARLFDLDEGVYVACARQMVLTGDFVTPRLNTRPHFAPEQTTVPFYEKPIMVYWAAAGALRVFGMSEGAARVPAATATLLATGMVAWLGARWFGKNAGLLAGLVYATSPMIVLDGRQMTTDALLTLWFLMTLWAIREQRVLLFSVSCGLAVLTKGPIGILLPVLVVLVHNFPMVPGTLRKKEYSRFSRMLSRAFSLKSILALLLFIVIVVPWHAAILRAGGRDADGRTWVQEYIGRQNVGRFKGGDKVHNAPLPTYFAYFLIGFFPWACLTPFAFRNPAAMKLQQRGAGETELPGEAKSTSNIVDDTRCKTHRLLLSWFWTIFVFFSLSAAKLPTYIVPGYPAAALLLGRWLDKKTRPGSHAAPAEVSKRSYADRASSDGRDKSLDRGISFALFVSALLLVAALLLPVLTRSRPVMQAALEPFVILVTLPLALGCLAAWLCFRRSHRGVRWVYGGLGSVTVAMTLVTLLVAGPGYALFNKWIFGPYQDLAMLARDDASKGIPVVFYRYGDRRPSLDYYAWTYAAFERKEKPLLPFLRAMGADAMRGADILTLRTTYEQELKPELDAAGWKGELIGVRDSGLAIWLLLRIHPNPHTEKTANPQVPKYGKGNKWPPYS